MIRKRTAAALGANTAARDDTPSARNPVLTECGRGRADPSRLPSAASAAR